MSAGPTGITGAYGLQGLRGLKGTPLGLTGPTFATITGRLAVVTPTTSPIYLTVGGFGQYYNITPTMVTNRTISIVFPQTTTSIPSTIELFPAPEQVGQFWGFKNNVGSGIQITFTQGTVTFNGSTGVTAVSGVTGVTSGGVAGVQTINLPAGQGFILGYTGSNTFTIF